MIPNIQWGQISDYVIFKIFINNVTNLNIDFNNNKLVFVGYSKELKYNLNVNFYKEIDDNLSNHSYKIYENHIECKVKKKLNENWHWLIQNQSFYKNHIKTDWNLLNNLLCLDESKLSNNSNLTTLIQSLNSNQNNNNNLNSIVKSNLNLNELSVSNESDDDSHENELASGDSTSDEEELLV